MEGEEEEDGDHHLHHNHYPHHIIIIIYDALRPRDPTAITLLLAPQLNVAGDVERDHNDRDNDNDMSWVIFCRFMKRDDK